MSDGFSPFGVHLVKQEDDLLTICWLGEVNVEDVRNMYELFSRIRAEHGAVFCLFDGRGPAKLGPEARRWLIKNFRSAFFVDASASFGESYAQRVLSTMINHTFRMLFKLAPPMGYFTTEAEARAYLDKERRRVRARQAEGALPR